MKKIFMLVILTVMVIFSALTAMAQGPATMQAEKAARIVEVVKPGNFAGLADLKIRKMLYENLGADMGGNVELQQAMAKYAAQDEANGLKPRALAVYNGTVYTPVAASEGVVHSEDPFAEDVVKPTSMKARVAQIQEEERQKLSGAPAAGVAPGHIYIPQKTKFKVELVNPASSKDLKKGQEVDIRITDNLIVNDVVVIPKGSIGKAYVYDVTSAGGMGRGGALKIAAREIKTINGVSVPLRMGLVGKGQQDGGAVAVFALVSMLGGAFMKGTNVNYPAGTAFMVEVSQNVDLQATQANLAAAMNPTVPRGTEIKVVVP